jgi:peptidoglycan/xylan/chitin deacetylase (PgdA/CDA1 family)
MKTEAGIASTRKISLMYHDIVADDGYSSSGFSGGGANRYKLTVREFDCHLKAIEDAARGKASADAPVHLTFDDGGVSAWEHTAEILERHGRRGTFFITTDYIGTAKFLSGAQIRDLRRRGHTIGTHSCSHPPLFARCPHSRIVQEWKDSAAVLSDVLGEAILQASVPGGFYGENVARAAAECGIESLFTSEPVLSVSRVGSCAVFGRYTIRRDTGARDAARLASGELAIRASQYLKWKSSKMLQTVGGSFYLRLRKSLLESRGRR